MDSKRFKVIICGGSVAGLSLANMLEANNVDFVVLEKHAQIAPNLGASIAVSANGARILDQLGCYKALSGQVPPHETIKHSQIRGPDGRMIVSIPDMTKHLIKRHGYGFTFFDRQQLVRALYDNIKDKSKILTTQGIVRIEELPGGVRVFTAAGDAFDGSIVVGADGVHSTIRKEMWRIADSEKPGYFDVRERNNASTTYAGIFGTCSAIPGFDLDSLVFTHGEGHSHFISVAHSKRIFWFLFVKIPEVRGLYEKLPRYTDKDRDELAAKHFDDHITEDVTWKMLWDRRTDAVMTPLTEYVLSKWHYNRMFTIGDAVAKFSPIGGQGGNSAIETAAVLTNLLHNALKDESQHGCLDDQRIENIFSTTTSTRIERLKRSSQVAHNRQQMEAHDTFRGKLMGKYMMRFMAPEVFLNLMSGTFTPSHRLEMLDLPAGEHDEPYLDERLTGDLKVKIPFLAVAASLLGVMVAALKWAPPPSIWLSPSVLRSLPMKLLIELAPTYYGSDIGRAHAIYSLVASFPLVVIANAEAFRYTSRGSLISLPFIFAIFGHLRGLAVAVPLYFIANIKSTSTDFVTGLAVPPAVAKSILPVMQVLYALAAILVISPAAKVFPLNKLLPLWLATPLFASIALFIINKRHQPKVATGFEVYNREDVPHLRTAYRTAALTGFALYGIVIGVAAYSVQQKNHLAGIVLNTLKHVKADMSYLVVATLIFAAYHLFELRRRGLVTTKEAFGAFGLVMPASIVAGPGAALAALWSWREGRLVMENRIARTFAMAQKTE